MTEPATRQKLYLYTIPKSGTYMVAELLELLGFANTGYHVAKTFYLDTKAHDLSVNAQTPSKATRKAGFKTVLKGLKPGEFAFGHLCPMEFPLRLRSGFDYVYGYRHPRQCLVSEFIDLRCRRKDVPEYSRSRIADDNEAFEAYLEKHGPDHRLQWGRFLAFHRALGRHFLPAGEECRALLYNFDKMRDPDKGPSEVSRLATFLVGSIDRSRSEDIHRKLLKTRTKTRRDEAGTEISPAELWTQSADEIYTRLAFADIETEIGLYLT